MRAAPSNGCAEILPPGLANAAVAASCKGRKTSGHSTDGPHVRKWRLWTRGPRSNSSFRRSIPETNQRLRHRRLRVRQAPHSIREPTKFSAHPWVRCGRFLRRRHRRGCNGRRSGPPHRKVRTARQGLAASIAARAAEQEGVRAPPWRWPPRRAPTRAVVARLRRHTVPTALAFRTTPPWRGGLACHHDYLSQNGGVCLHRQGRAKAVL